MPVLLFKLNGVPDQEADEIRALLGEHRIDFYETSAGRWGISLAGIWLRDDTHLERARELIDAYQRERTARVRQDYARRQSEGGVETLPQRIRRNPLEFLMVVLAVLLIVYLSIRPFLSIGG
jgi:hypothetical protein